MNKVLKSVAAVVALALPLAASAVTTTYTFNLSAAPPVPSPAVGSFTLTLDDVLDTISFTSVSLNLVGPVTMSHIHAAMDGSSGPVVFDLLGAADSSGPLVIGMTVIPGSFAYTGAGKAIASSLVDLINATPWAYYVNVHTEAFPGGEIRGQLAAVPEPATYALLAAGLGIVGAAARRRKQAA